MFHFPLSKLEHLWLLALRLVWNHSRQREETIRLVDALWRSTGKAPIAESMFEVFAALERAGAGHLYIEAWDQTGITGDERDLLACLRACYLDDVLATEQALSALLPPGETAPVIEAMCRITQRRKAQSPRPLPGLPYPTTESVLH